MNSPNGNRPGFCELWHELILEIAKERGQDPEEFKASLLAKIREKGADTAATVPTPTNSEHRHRTKEGDH